MRDSEDDAVYFSPVVRSAAKLLRHMAGGETVANMAKTAREISVNRTTLLRLLRTLEAEHFIEPCDDRPGWRIGLGLIGLAAQSLSSDLVQATLPPAQKLAERVGLSVHLAQLDGAEVLYLARAVPDRVLVSNMRIGSRLPAHASNIGRIILAHLEPERVRRIFEGVALSRVTAQTPGDLEELEKRLAVDRSLGLAWSNGYFETGISSVAAPIFGRDGRPIAGLNISGQSAKFESAERERIARALRETAEEISRRLGWTGAAKAAQPASAALGGDTQVVDMGRARSVRTAS